MAKVIHKMILIDKFINIVNKLKVVRLSNESKINLNHKIFKGLFTYYATKTVIFQKKILSFANLVFLVTKLIFQSRFTV